MPYQTTQVPVSTSRMMNQAGMSAMPQMGMPQQNMMEMAPQAQRQEWAGEITPMGGGNKGNTGNKGNMGNFGGNFGGGQMPSMPRPGGMRG